MRTIASTLVHTTTIFSSMEFICALLTLLAFAVSGLRRPGLWPPLSDGPWRAAGLGDFWRRWHQLFRPLFVAFGARPGYALGGRTGALLGAFGASAGLHSVCLLGIGRGSDARAGLSPVVQSVGVLAEKAWARGSRRAGRA
jgi:hypothetical protein